MLQNTTCSFFLTKPQPETDQGLERTAFNHIKVLLKIVLILLY